MSALTNSIICNSKKPKISSFSARVNNNFGINNLAFPKQVENKDLESLIESSKRRKETIGIYEINLTETNENSSRVDKYIIINKASTLNDLNLDSLEIYKADKDGKVSLLPSQNISQQFTVLPSLVSKNRKILNIRYLETKNSASVDMPFIMNSKNSFITSTGASGKQDKVSSKIHFERSK